MFEGKTQLEKGALRVLGELHRSGFEAYFAGGCVRDALQGIQPKDYDIATSATPDEIQALFPHTVAVGAHFGVIMVIHDHHPYEVATFRTEGSYKDGRRPESVQFCTVEEDVRRRDFTVNGLYYDIQKKKVLDFVEGQKDLARKLIRTIGDPLARFLEDHLRMIRAVRFAVKLDFAIDPPILEVIRKHSALLADKVSMERIQAEFGKILTSPSPGKGVRLLDETGLLIHFLPEVERMKGVEQPPQYHPEGDVYVHTLLLLDQLSCPPLELAMGALLHDIAKPDTFERAADRIRFHGHDTIGAEKSEVICKRLKFSNEQTHVICELVRQHLRFKDAPQMKKSTLRRFLGMDHIDWHLELHRIDCLASHKNLDHYEFCKAKLGEFQKEPPPPLQLLKGGDLIALGYPTGPKMGKILKAVEDAILEGQIQDKESAIRFVSENFTSSGDPK